MNPLDAIQFVTRWLRETQTDLARARRRIRELEHDVLNLERQLREQDTQMNYMRDWMNTYTPAQIVELAADLEAVA